jgi:hypothetical protein
VEYVRGEVRTNGLENFWSLLKLGLSGTYVSVQTFHLFRYIDEQAFRYNYRKGLNDGGRFMLALSQIAGKRLTSENLTGKDIQPDPSLRVKAAGAREAEQRLALGGCGFSLLLCSLSKRIRHSALGYGQYRFRRALEPIRRFRPFYHFGVRLHVLHFPIKRVFRVWRQQAERAG